MSIGIHSVEHRHKVIEWLNDFVKSKNYRKIRYFNVYYPHLGEPFLQMQRHCIIVDDFSESPIGIIDFTGYHYVKKNHVHGETTVHVDNFIHGTHIYEMYKCLKETISLRLDNYEPFRDGFQERRIVDSYCDMIIKEYETEMDFHKRTNAAYPRSTYSHEKTQTPKDKNNEKK